MNTEQLRSIDRRHVWHPYTHVDTWEAEPNAPVIQRASGVWLHDTEGKRYLDAVGSWWVSNLGHGYPRVREAMEAQLGRMSHAAMADMASEPATRLAQRLVEYTPKGLNRVFYSDNGSTAVEVALRASFQYWQQMGQEERTLFATFSGAYHGDTIGTVAVGGIPVFHAKLGPLCFETLQLPSPTEGLNEDQLRAHFNGVADQVRANRDRLSAMIVEPLVQGSSGMRMTPPIWLKWLRELCDEVGIHLIADEVFVGFGRTGAMFACELAEITPDFMCLSKGLTGGFMPFAATLCTDDIIDGFRGDPSRTFMYGHSYCGNPLGASAALAVLDAFEKDQILEQAKKNAAWMRDALAEISSLPGVASVRQQGLIGAIQLGSSSDYRDRSGWRIAMRLRQEEVYLRPLGNVLPLVPALNIKQEELQHLFTALRRCLLAD